MQPSSHIGLNPNRTHSTPATQDEVTDNTSKTSTKTTNQSRRILGQSPVERQNKKKIRYQRQKARDIKLQQRSDAFDCLNPNPASATARLQKEYKNRSDAFDCLNPNPTSATARLQEKYKNRLEKICEEFDSTYEQYDNLVEKIFIPLKKLIEALGHLNCCSSSSNDLFRLFIANIIPLSQLIKIIENDQLLNIQHSYQRLEKQLAQFKDEWRQCQAEHPALMQLDFSDGEEMLSLKNSLDTFLEELLKSITPRLETLQSTGSADNSHSSTPFFKSDIPKYLKYAENILLCFHTQLEELTQFYNQHAEQKITDQNRQIWEKNYRELRRMKELLGLELAPDILPDAEFHSDIYKKLGSLSPQSIDTKSESASTASAHSSDSDSESNSTQGASVSSSIGESYDDDYSSTSEQNQTLLQEIETLYQIFENKLTSNDDDDSAYSLDGYDDSIDSLDDDFRVSSRHKTNKKGKSSDHRTARFLQKQKPQPQASKSTNPDKPKEKGSSDHNQYYVRNNRLVPAPSTSKSPPQRTARVVDGKTVDRQKEQGGIPAYIQPSSGFMKT